MFWWDSARGARGLAPEALDELLVFGEVVVQHLHRDLPAEQLVLGEVHLGHAPGPEPREHPVAPVDDRLGLDHRSRLSITCLATGAANAAPCPGTPCRVTAIATVGLSAGAKAMNHTLLIAVADLRLGRARLAGHLDARDLGRGAGAFVDDRFHHRGDRRRRRGLHHDRLHARGDPFDRAPVGVDDPVGQMGDHQPAVVGHRRGDLGHLQRDDLEFVLADAHAPDVDQRARGRDQARSRDTAPLADICSAG